MEKDTRLEKLSEDIRRGIPVSVSEAFEAIDYQEALKAYRKSLPWWQKLFCWG